MISAKKAKENRDIYIKTKALNYIEEIKQKIKNDSVGGCSSVLKEINNNIYINCIDCFDTFIKELEDLGYEITTKKIDQQIPQ